jgi:hypothetical protein
MITFIGVAGADGQVTQPIGIAADGTPIYQRQVPAGFLIVIEAKPGSSNPVGTTTFDYVPGDPNTLPNLQIVVSRPLGDGNPRVCDNQNNPPIGGVPAVDPPMFGGSLASAAAINDLGCRFDARLSAQGGPTTAGACTRNASQEPAFVSSQTKVQFCPQIGIGIELAFPTGDTRVTARVTDTLGQPGMAAAIIVRISP